MLSGRSEVLIVGAGPAGCAAGITLARAGIDVCVVDRAHFPRDKTCGDAVSNRGVRILEDFGASAAVRAGAQVNGAVAVLPDGTRILRKYKSPGIILPRLQLDDALWRALEKSGARAHQGVAVQKLTVSGRHVEGAEGDQFRWKAGVVIAADGPGSVAWKSIGRSPPKGRHLAVSATVYLRGVDLADGPDITAHYFERDLPCGYGWAFPAVDGLCNAGVYQRIDRYDARGVPLRDLLESFLRRHPELASAERVGKTRSWQLPLAKPPWPPGAPGLLLIGDAGSFVDPLSGEGIWQALHTGILAGQTATRAVRGGGLDGGLVRAYARACARSIGWASEARAGVQLAMEWIVDRGLDRSKIVQGLLRFGYGGGMAEHSKSA